MRRQTKLKTKKKLKPRSKENNMPTPDGLGPQMHLRLDNDALRKLNSEAKRLGVPRAKLIHAAIHLLCSRDLDGMTKANAFESAGLDRMAAR